MSAPSNQSQQAGDELELVEVGALSRREWIELTQRDPAAFGHSTAGLIYRDKELHVAWRANDGRLVAALGLAIVTVEVEGHRPFDVVGMGSLIVRQDHRGRGLSLRLSEAARAREMQLGPDRAMIFCEQELVEWHLGRGYLPIGGPVRVDQPDGRIVMPIPALWRPIRPSEWPAGAVDVQGFPF
jgi:GNAT superfamily N-acetyltransferase